jgi:DNA-binding Xre family transcriptional regulator
MKAIHELFASLQKAVPAAKFRLDEPENPKGEWFLDVVHRGKGLVIQWREGGPFGLSSMGEHVGMGQKADELYPTTDAAEARIVKLLSTGGTTSPPAEVSLRELRAERNLSQTRLAELTGMHQPAVSRLEQKDVSSLVVATLEIVVKALGGKLVMQVEFPDGTVKKLRVGKDDVAVTAQRP